MNARFALMKKALEIRQMCAQRYEKSLECVVFASITENRLTLVVNYPKRFTLAFKSVCLVIVI